MKQPLLKRLLTPFFLVLTLSISLASAASAQDWHTYFTNPRDPDGYGHDEIDVILAQKIIDFANNAGNNSILKMALYEIEPHSSYELVSAIKTAHDILKTKGGEVQIVANFGNTADFTSGGAGLDGYHGLSIVYSDPPSQSMHNKFIIFDDVGNNGSTYDDWVWSGSYNPTNRAQNYQKNNVIFIRNRDLASTSSGFGHEFREMYNENHFGVHKASPWSGSFTIDGGQGSFHFSPKGNTRQALIDAINTADDAIYFNIFAFTDQTVADAIKNKITSGDIAASDVHGDFDKWWHNSGDKRKIYEELLALGADVNLVAWAGPYLHDKFIVIDPDTSDPTVVTGSANWSGTGFTRNDENVVVIHHGGIARSYRNHQQGGVVGVVPEPSTIVLFIFGSSAAVLFRFRYFSRER